MSKIEITKEDLKKPDQFTAIISKALDWAIKNSKIVLGGIASFIVFGLAIVLISYLDSQKELAQQEKYFLLEKKYTDTKRNFEEAARVASVKATDKNSKEESKFTAATGDLTKDYGTLVPEFESFIENAHGTKAAQMAALHLSNLYQSYGKNNEATALLEKITHDLENGEVLKALILLQKGSVLANQDKCQDALTAWEKVTKDKGLSYAHDEAKLRSGLCYEKLNDLAKAETIYTELAKKENNNDVDLVAVKEAQKYLRLLKVKQNL